MTLISPDRLASIVTAVFEAVGVPPDMAATGADVLVTTDLRGIDTHGVASLLPKYLEWYRVGEINPAPRWRVVAESAATANIDADRGLGIMLAPAAMELAVEKARTCGIGMVALRGGRHLGACGYHASLAIRHDMVGICMTASPPFMVPPGGRDPMVGSNPIAVAVPAGRHAPFLFDAAMTVASGHHVVRARKEGVPVRGGLVASADGSPVMEPAPAPEFPRLLPLGSTPESGSYKGFGLAMVVEILAGILSGSGFAARLGFDVANHVVMAVDVAAFGEPDTFKRDMDEYLATLEATPPAAGTTGVHTPGARAWETERRRRVEGIPVDDRALAWLRRTCDDLGVAWEPA